MLTTDQKGAIAELAIAREAAELGVGVFKPLTDGERYDLIFDFRPQLMRVQCKWAPLDGQTVIVRCYSNRRAREGLRRRAYTADEADAIGAYCPDLRRSFLVPASQFDGHSQLLLRLAASRNNQRLGINWADDFDLGARLVSLLGAVAQLGERSDGIRKVRGSIPLGSIAITEDDQAAGSPLQRTGLGSADLQAAWEEHAEEFIAWAREPGFDSYWRFHRDQFLQLVPPPSRRTLDLGCGEGRLSRDLKALGHTVVAVDASPTMVAAARDADSEL